MKKILFCGLILMLSCGSGLAALTTDQRVEFTVNVSSVFELSIDQGSIDFGRMKPGESKEDMPPAGITLTAKTNNQRPWFIKISNESEFTNGSDMISNSNFIWNGWTDGSGKWAGTGTNKMMLTPALAYSSGPGEDNNLPAGTANHFKFMLNVPEKQSPGNYSTTVKFTMTE